jgi:hypothetical protein
MHVTSTALLDVATVTMSAWIRPVEYDVSGCHYDGECPYSAHGIIMCKEGAYEMGLEETGALQAAFR